MIEKIKQLTSSKEEFDELFSFEVLLVVYGYDLDDNSLSYDFVKDYSYIHKLRGRYDESPKLANTANNQRSFHGYVYGIDQNHPFADDRKLMLLRLDTARIIEKYDIKKYKEDMQNQIFNTFFEEI